MIGIITHNNPDGDAIGSAAALRAALHKIGIDSQILYPGQAPDHCIETVGKLDYIDRVTDNIKLLVYLDCADITRSDYTNTNNLPMINIDHHASNTNFGTLNMVNPKAASTTEMVYGFIKDLGIEICEYIASCIYMGIITDTDGLRQGSVTDNTFKVLSELVSYGVDPSKMADRHLNKIPKPRAMAISRVLANASFENDGEVAWYILNKNEMDELNITREHLHGVSQNLANIRGVRLAVLFVEIEEGKFEASLRSSRDICASAIAKMFGGGGHTFAAGFRLEGCVKRAIKRITSRIGG